MIRTGSGSSTPGKNNSCKLVTTKGTENYLPPAPRGQAKHTFSEGRSTPTVDMDMLETSKAIFVVGILSPVKVILRKRAATIEVETQRNTRDSCKRELSAAPERAIHLPCLFASGPGLPCKHLKGRISQDKARHARDRTNVFIRVTLVWDGSWFEVPRLFTAPLGLTRTAGGPRTGSDGTGPDRKIPNCRWDVPELTVARTTPMRQALVGSLWPGLPCMMDSSDWTLQDLPCTVHESF